MGELFILLRNQIFLPNAIFQFFLTTKEPMIILNYLITHNDYLNSRLYSCGILKLLLHEYSRLIKKKQKLKVQLELEKKLYKYNNEIKTEVLSIFKRLIQHSPVVCIKN